MISAVLSLLLAASAAQSDTTRTQREAYTACLRGFVQRSIDARMSQADFNTAFPAACPQQEAAYRAAVIARENGNRATRATAAESANAEIEDAQFNFRERFEMAMPASASTATATAPTAQPAPAATSPQ